MTRGPVIIAQRARRRGAARRGLDARPYGGEIVDSRLYGRAAAVSKSDFATFTFAPPARWRRQSLRAWPSRAASSCFHLRRGVRRQAGPRLAAEAGPDEARLPDRRRPATRVITAHNGCRDGARRDGARRHSPTPASTRCRAPRPSCNALYAQNTRLRRDHARRWRASSTRT